MQKRLLKFKEVSMVGRGDQSQYYLIPKEWLVGIFLIVTFIALGIVIYFLYTKNF